MNGRFICGILAVWIGVPAAGCSKEPAGSNADPPRVSAKVQQRHVVIKNQDVYLDGTLIRPQTTTAAEVEAITGYDPGYQASADAYWNATGIIIFANTADHLPGRPKLVHSVRVWLGQEVDLQKSRTCTAAEEEEHMKSVLERTEQISINDAKRGWARSELIEEIRREKCSRAGVRPAHPFDGRLEVDGVSIAPGMTLGQVQSLRQATGLLPLRVHPVSGRPYFQAPMAKGQPGWRQEWEFSWPTDEVNGDDVTVKVISVP